MGLTIALITDFEATLGSMRLKVADVTFDASYPAGGEVIDKAAVGLRTKIEGALIIGGNAVAGAYMCHYDHANGKLMLFYPTGGAANSPAAVADPVQGSPTVDSHASGQTVTARLSGANTITTWLNATALSDTPTLAHVVSVVGSGVPGRGKELLATTNASTITFRIAFFGR